jgi:hypothetical protein
LVVAVRVSPVATRVSVTVAPGTTDPVLSVTTPVIAVDVVCAQTADTRATNRSTNITLEENLRTPHLLARENARVPVYSTNASNVSSDAGVKKTTSIIK